MTRILFALTPTTGQVHPVLPVVQRLAQDGHDVTVYTGERFGDAIAATGARHAPTTIGRDMPEELVEDWSRRNGAPPPGLRRLRWDVLHHVVLTIPGFLVDLADVVRDERPDVIVSDTAMVAGVLAGRVHGIPTVSLSVSPLSLTSRDTFPFGMGLQPPQGPVERARAAWMRVAVQRWLFRAAQREALQVVGEAGLPRPRGFVLDWAQTLADRVLHLSVPGLEYPRADLPAHVEVVGATARSGPAAPFDEPAWWPWLHAARASGRRVVVVTQGTLATDPAQLVLPALDALRGEDVLVVATTGAPGLERAVPATRRAENVVVERFVPFEHLLPLADVLVTNGGFGGVQEALAHGVPVVVAGRSQAKAEVGARVRWSGAGVVVPTDRVTDAATPAAVLRGVRQVLTDQRFAARARELSREYAAHDGASRAADVVLGLAGRGALTADPA
ncbi:nucleotide disphospho-sugar-binding domain-containing protein [Cellulomonas sp.]|uniref:nucleotide disphospho-sugar-binding domain-containing protein n=1 Tax=Cellulomonas sp. TaxID=40001 RepID=UPI00258A17DE|nr:nucleotide disphospho-sugar-binding domain-containing protein [Cellulomonas sp.]MCR6689569.1 glycosyltransferase [Cellulomonas sp.]